MLASPVRCPVKTGQIRCHLAGLLFGTSLLFLVTVLATLAAHKQLMSWERTAGLLQSAELEVQQLGYMAMSGRLDGVGTVCSHSEFFSVACCIFVLFTVLSGCLEASIAS